MFGETPRDRGVFIYVLMVISIAIVVVGSVALFMVATSPKAHAHEWYSTKHDPVHLWSCCGGNDCKEIVLDKKNVTAEKQGYRVILSLAESRVINPNALQPVNALVIWDRVQPSPDGNWHICIAIDYRGPPTGGVYCLFQPPST